MANEVVLGDLSLDSRDDCLKFDGGTTSDVVTTGQNIAINNNSVIKGSFVLSEVPATLQYAFDNSPPGDNGYLLRYNSNSFLQFIAWTTGGVVFVTSPYDCQAGDVIDYEIILDGSSITLNVNGVAVVEPYSGSPIQPTSGNLAIGNDQDLVGNQLAGDLMSFEIVGVLKYVTKGNFGTTQLIDSYGNYNGTIIGCQWWKRGVDETYSTEQLYKSSWANPMDEDQRVVDQLGNYRYDNSFWNPYNQDATYSFDLINGIKNEVVLGDLALDSRDDCLRFDGGYTPISIPVVVGDRIKVIVGGAETLSDFQYICDGNIGGRCLIALHNMAWSNSYGTTADRAYDGDGEYWFTVNTNSTIQSLGARYTGIDNWTGFFCCFELVGKVRYIENGDFGSATLVDHSGNGNTVPIGSATWWKQDVDENYATSQLYKSTLVSPLTEDQNVVYTDATPYYASDDVFWNPYNQDVNFDFTVSKTEDPICAGCKTYSYSYSYSY